MEYDQFTSLQNSIYQQIEDQQSNVLQNGIKPSPNVMNGESGYLVAFRHEDPVNQVISDISSGVADQSPVIKYNDKNIHTTLSSYLVSDKTRRNVAILEELAQIVKNVLANDKYGVLVEYEKLLLSTDAVILCGMPNYDFFRLSKAIVEEAHAQNTALSLPKMSHITIARFIEARDKKKTEDIFKYIQNQQSPSLKSEITTLIVGFFETSPQGFDLQIHTTLKL